MNPAVCSVCSKTIRALGYVVARDLRCKFSHDPKACVWVVRVFRPNVFVEDHRIHATEETIATASPGKSVTKVQSQDKNECRPQRHTPFVSISHLPRPCSPSPSTCRPSTLPSKRWRTTTSSFSSASSAVSTATSVPSVRRSVIVSSTFVADGS